MLSIKQLESATKADKSKFLHTSAQSVIQQKFAGLFDVGDEFSRQNVIKPFRSSTSCFSYCKCRDENYVTNIRKFTPTWWQLKIDVGDLISVTIFGFWLQIFKNDSWCWRPKWPQPSPNWLHRGCTNIGVTAGEKWLVLTKWDCLLQSAIKFH